MRANFNTKRIAFSLIYLFLLYVAFEYAKIHSPYTFGFQTTKSITCDLFLYKRKNLRPEKIPRNTLVLFRVSEDYGPLGDIVSRLTLIKHLTGLPGEYLLCDNNVCFLDGVKIAPDVPPELTPNFRQTIGFIPPGFFAPTGDCERSYDVRFAGVTSLKGLKGKVVFCLYKARECWKPERKNVG